VLSKEEVLQQIRAVGLLPVLRADSEELAMALAMAIAAAGVRVLEVTMTVPGALHLIQRLAKERPDILVGAGTVLDPGTARSCIDAGAQFVVSPALNVSTIELCQRHSIAVFPERLRRPRWLPPGGQERMSSRSFRPTPWVERSI